MANCTMCNNAPADYSVSNVEPDNTALIEYMEHYPHLCEKCYEAAVQEFGNDK